MKALSLNSRFQVQMLLNVFRLIFIIVVAFQCALFGYSRDGVLGLILGLVIGGGVGFLSSYIWVLVFALIFQAYGIVTRLSKHSVTNADDKTRNP